MTDVYLLWHVRPEFEETGDDADAKLLGVFSSEERANDWRDEAKTLPGFRETPECFVLDRYAVDQRECTSGFVTVGPGD